jgi:hypothetical protein
VIGPEKERSIRSARNLKELMQEKVSFSGEKVNRMLTARSWLGQPIFKWAALQSFWILSRKP